MSSIKMKKADLIEIQCENHEGFEVLEDTVHDTSRWSIHKYMTFKEIETGKIYGVSYSEGATESQYESPFEYEGDEIEVDELREAMLVVRRFVGVDYKPENEHIEPVIEGGMSMYMAINKETKGIMQGAKGQITFDNTATLGRSVGNNYAYTARKQGVKPRDLYEIHEIIVNTKTQQIEYVGVINK